MQFDTITSFTLRTYLVEFSLTIGTNDLKSIVMLLLHFPS